LIPPFPEIQKNLRLKRSSYALSLSFYISDAHTLAGMDLLFTSDKVDPATLDKALDGLVPKNI
jgi:hypothetical protein